MDRKIKIGIIGAGRIGKMHAENIRANFSNVEIKSVADLFADKIKDWANSIGINNIFVDPAMILEDEEIDAVLICSSTDTHSRLIMDSARAGKHIFCEKPIDFNLERIHQALDSVEKAGVKLQIGFQRRFDPSFRKAFEMIRQGKIGDPHILKITSRDPQPPPIDYIKVSGGIFLDMTIHDFDMARYLSGSEVTEVYASGAVLVDPAIGNAGDIDTAVVTLKFENGAIGVIDNSRRSTYGYDQRVEVFGSKGCVSVSNDILTNTVLSDENGITADKPKYFFIERYKDAYIEEIKAFFDSILNDKQPPVTGIDGLEPVIIGLAAKKSLVEGKPVKIQR
ncbi:MAG: myo-inositol 2-dehydrogenase / D-chiro-inositol 1-dehydrogenase [Thermoanaerobacteraceae bacterium]|jgi:myo-inositol 2-dehydrogenase/D-chiro-inositol 1-dehydrogenase|nr:myo-inositol 2-dehydrogenase / D-chiro-inositol 1-dehydrogenase [Thermoanaerobacteraceae bacterium]MDN5313578.1 myo-inositol 2-dehydrogenase / D-chiro-inositol 1-dehydrogenase [Thermoanaerobacteraceae bacterium]